MSGADADREGETKILRHERRQKKILFSLYKQDLSIIYPFGAYTQVELFSTRGAWPVLIGCYGNLIKSMCRWKNGADHCSTILESWIVCSGLGPKDGNHSTTPTRRYRGEHY